MKELYNAVCNNDLEYVEEYYDTADTSPEITDSEGIADISLIMTALRNGHVEMIRLLERHGETILDTETEEYERRIEPLYAAHYKNVVENFLRGNTLHLEFEYDEKNNLSSLCKVMKKKRN